MMPGEAPRDKKPILIGNILLIGLLLDALADRVLGSVQGRQAEAVSSLRESPTSPTAIPIAPAGLQDAVEQLVRRETGPNGALVRSVEDDWTAGFRGATTFPQGSLRRIRLRVLLPRELPCNQRPATAELSEISNCLNYKDKVVDALGLEPRTR